MANIRQVKRTEERVEIRVRSDWAIQSWGHNNLYPRDIVRLVSASDTGETCLSRYANFIEGDGFASEEFAARAMNARGETADDLHSLVSGDVALFRGFALLVKYGLMGRISEVYHVPFEQCRLGEPDESGYVSRIAVFPDWEGKKKYGGRVKRPSKETIDYFPVFNPKPLVVQAQMDAAGGPEHYRGQIMWVSSAGRTTYPKAKYDAAISYLSTEDGLGNISNRNVRNGFFPAGMLMIRKGLDTAKAIINPETNKPFLRDELIEMGILDPQKETRSRDGSDIAGQIHDLQGDQNSGKIWVCEYEFDEDRPHFEPWQSKNYDKDFTVTSDNAVERIYAIFEQEVFYRIRTGQVGFSGSMMTEAYEYYSSVTAKERRMIERAFDQIVTNLAEPLPREVTRINPLKYVSTPNNAGGTPANTTQFFPPNTLG